MNVLEYRYLEQNKRRGYLYVILYEDKGLGNLLNMVKIGRSGGIRSEK